MRNNHVDLKFCKININKRKKKRRRRKKERRRGGERDTRIGFVSFYVKGFLSENIFNEIISQIFLKYFLTFGSYKTSATAENDR
jgi:hypothetical protein